VKRPEERGEKKEHGATMTSEIYFKRQIELWGEETQAALASKKIALVGCGGLGSSLALALGGSGVGTIYLIDPDTVALHNIHRQVAFTLADENQPKAYVTAAAIRAKNPFVSVTPFAMDFEAFAALDNAVDLILDATDNLPARTQIDAWAKAHALPWVYGSAEGFHGQVCLFDRASFDVFAAGDHSPEGIAAPMVMQVASLQANVALRYLAGMPVAHDLLYYLYFDDDGALVTQRFGMPI
jgi:adenylyltransferase/sulfurtransferase